MHYRKKYIKETGIDLDDEYEVHHIDYDRSNNDIRNLVAIPKNTHSRIHKYANEYLKSITSISSLRYFYKPEKLKILKSIDLYMDAKEEINPYLNIRDGLLNNKSK